VDKPPLDGIQQRPRSGATRCPFCHDECQAGQEACACADCLSRHHLGCWDEAGGCSSCRSTNRLVATPSASGVRVPGNDPRYAEVIDAWLRLGLVYNGSLGGLTALILWPLMLDGGVIASVVAGALVANVCFLLGPGIELVARRFGFKKTRPLRWTLFVAGLGIAGILAIVSCVSLYY